ncbi:MAG: transposase [Ignavibacteriaceae bacterium]|nr:transposase [Ignavibacteriaceae bacterium]
MKDFPKRKSTRLKEYDYSQFGYYFITICMKNRKEFFSKIENSIIVLSKFGKIIDEVLINIPSYYNVEIDCYIIMPDHIHLIIILDKDESKKNYSLSDVMGKFKSFSCKKIRKVLEDDEKFEWQKSFYDRIIRNEKELYQIRKYIKENPLRWEIEKDNPDNLIM